MKQGDRIKNPLHTPVLPNEVVSFFNINPNGVYVDGTCGLGGHSKLILNNLSEHGSLIAIDLDQSAIKEAQLNLLELYGALVSIFLLKSFFRPKN